MENRNFLVLDGGLGLELIRAGFDINVSNKDTFFVNFNIYSQSTRWRTINIIYSGSGFGNDQDTN